MSERAPLVVAVEPPDWHGNAYALVWCFDIAHVDDDGRAPLFPVTGGSIGAAIDRAERFLGELAEAEAKLGRILSTDEAINLLGAKCRLTVRRGER